MTKKRLRYLWLLPVTAGVVAAAVQWHLGAVAREIAEDETHTVAALQLCLRAQNQFHRADRYGNGFLVYANPEDGAGFPDLYQIGGPGSGGKVLGLIPEAMARATVGGTPWNSYVFADIEYGDYSIDCGLRAIPVAPGRRELEIDMTGPVYSASPRSGATDDDPPAAHFSTDGYIAVGSAKDE